VRILQRVVLSEALQGLAALLAIALWIGGLVDVLPGPWWPWLIAAPVVAAVVLVSYGRHRRVRSYRNLVIGLIPTIGHQQKHGAGAVFEREVLPAIADAIGEFGHVRNCKVLILFPSGSELIIRFSNGLTASQHNDWTFPASGALAALCSGSITSIACSDIQSEGPPIPDDLLVLAKHGFRSLLAAPIRNGGQPEGALCVAHSRPGRFDADDAGFLEDAAVLASQLWSLGRVAGEI
jgi:transcriptional regulator with GAF, ATPase, and Fis domain